MSRNCCRVCVVMALIIACLINSEEVTGQCKDGFAETTAARLRRGRRLYRLISELLDTNTADIRHHIAGLRVEALNNVWIVEGSIPCHIYFVENS